MNTAAAMPHAARSRFTHQSGFAFRLLGPFEVSLNGQAREVPRRKQRLLLTLLLLSHEDVLSIDRLVDQLWGEHPPKTAVSALQNLVSEVRKALGSDVVRTQAAGYSIGVDRDSVDVHRFEQLVVDARDEQDAEHRAQQLRNALALWRGPPLLEFAAEPFAQVEIARLHELRTAAREELVEAELELGHHAQLIGELEALVIEQPLRERLRAQLMIALYRSGRQAEALSAYRSARRMLADELGLEPSDQLQQVERAILTQDPALAGTRSIGAAQALAATPPTRAALPPPRRVRRQRRWAAALGGLVIAAVIAVLALERMRGSNNSIAIAPDSVAIVDAQSTRVIGDVGVGRRPVAIAIGEGAVWVANGDDGTVTRIDPETRKRTEAVRIETDINDLATGFGSIWTADGKDGTVTRFDPKRNERTRIVLGGSADPAAPAVKWVAAGAGAVWATRGDSLFQIDPADNEVVKRTPIPTPTGLTAGLGAAWVVTDDDQLLQVPPGKHASPIVKAALTHDATAPTVGAGSVWVIVYHDTGEIWRIDPDSGATRSFADAGRYPLDLAVADDSGYVWVVDSTGAVIRINPTIELAVAEIRPAATRQSAIAVGRRAVWVTIQQ